MKALVRLMTSPFAVIRAVMTVLATLFASQAGVWYENSLFGELAVFYSLAYGIVILAKGGGDAAFTKQLAAGHSRVYPLGVYLSTSGLRLAITAPVVGAFAFYLIDFEILDVIALISLSVAILIGNALRISFSPNYQLGIDNSTFTIVAILLAISAGLPVWISGLSHAAALLIFQMRSLRRSEARIHRPVSVLQTCSGPYLISEISYYLMGFAAPAMISLVADLNTVGEIRSVERIVFAGTFALFVVNNRLFFDLSTKGNTGFDAKNYLRIYTLPSTLFFALTISVLLLGTFLGFLPNIASQPAAFTLYAGAYLVSVACGPVSGALNFLGQEKFVMISSLFGAAIVLFSLVVAIHLQSPFLIVLGSALGITSTNLAQAFRLFVQHEKS